MGMNITNRCSCPPGCGLLKKNAVPANLCMIADSGRQLNSMLCGAKFGTTFWPVKEGRPAKWPPAIVSLSQLPACGRLTPESNRVVRRDLPGGRALCPRSPQDRSRLYAEAIAEADAPGNVLLPSDLTGLSKDSVANVFADPHRRQTYAHGECFEAPVGQYGPVVRRD
jgi:hypothetical protein